MGGLCSGRSDTPTSLEPPAHYHKNHDKTVGAPKNSAGVALHTDEYSLGGSQAKLEMVDTTPVKNIKVEEYLKKDTPQETAEIKDGSAITLETNDSVAKK